MNERIRELAVQAGFYANPNVEKFEKFAELIVQECIDICNAYSTIEGISNKIRDDIKETFGVEE